MKEEREQQSFKFNLFLIIFFSGLEGILIGIILTFLRVEGITLLNLLFSLVFIPCSLMPYVAIRACIRDLLKLYNSQKSKKLKDEELKEKLHMCFIKKTNLLKTCKTIEEKLKIEKGFREEISSILNKSEVENK